MAKKKRTPAEYLRELETDLRESFERWQEIRVHGCSDPYWPDGTNINLVRNHCIYYRRKIRELCDFYGFPLPEIYERPIPPEMPQDFMARPRKLVTDVSPVIPKVTSPVQLSLF